MFNYFNKIRFKTDSSDEEPINVGFGNQFFAVGQTNTAALHDACIFTSVLLQHGSDGRMCVLGLLWACNFAGANRPDWLLCDTDQ